jgi:hypothetical protein
MITVNLCSLILRPIFFKGISLLRLFLDRKFIKYVKIRTFTFKTTFETGDYTKADCRKYERTSVA